MGGQSLFGHLSRRKIKGDGLLFLMGLLELGLIRRNAMGQECGKYPFSMARPDPKGNQWQKNSSSHWQGLTSEMSCFL
jgi:hypothetical protein